MISFVLGLFLLVLPPELDLQSKTTSQSEKYITAIFQNKNDAGVYYWALTENFFSNCKVQEKILDRLKNSSSYNYYKNIELCGSEENSFNRQKLDILVEVALSKGYINLFAYYLTQEREKEIAEKRLQAYSKLWSEQNLELLEALIKRNPVNPQRLNEEKNQLLYLGLITSPHRAEYITEAFLTKAVDIWSISIEESSIKDDLQNSILISNFIAASYLIYDNENILKHYQSFLSNPHFPNSYLKISRYNAIDYTHYMYGNYNESLNIQRNFSLPLVEYLSEKEEKQKILSRHGAYLFALGKYQDSKDIYEQLQLESDSTTANYTLFNNLGINYLKLGEKNQFLKLQFRALSENISNYNSLLSIYRNLFIYYSSIKDIDTALLYIEKARNVAQENSDKLELARIESYLGTFYWSTYKDYEKALYYFSEAEKEISFEEHYEAYRDLLIGKGEILLEIDSLRSAKSAIALLKHTTLQKSDSPAYLHSLILESLYFLKKRKIDDAEKILNEIKIYSLEDLDFELLTKYYTVKADYLYKSGHLRKAIKELNPVITQVIDRAKNSTDSQAGYWTVEDEYLDAISLMVNMLTENNDFGEALNLLDQLKTINDASLYNSPLIKASKLSEQDLAEEKRLNDQLQGLRKQYLNSSEENRLALKTQIDRTSAAREEILSTVNLAKQKPLSPVWAIQRTLQEDELLLHFTEIGSVLYMTQLSSRTIEIQSHSLDKESQEYLTSTADNIASGKTNLQELYSIYKKLGLENLPKGIKQITVIPDNYLYRIPLEILPSQKPASPVSYGSAKYMIEDYHFRYFTSLQEFENNRRSAESFSTDDFSAFAISDFSDVTLLDLPSLPFATSEANSISTALSSFTEKNIYTGNSATKHTFLDKVTSSRMVHVATHSEVSEQDPLFSTIYLKGNSTTDSLESDQALYAYELFNTSLNSEFIMLNSCSSGSGTYMQGTGIMGISRALRYAGAKSLALNLWSVNDKVASIFATDFYSFINSGETKSEAIRQAKLNQLRSANANPHFWGAYMMIGNPSPMINKPAKPYLLYSLLGTTIVLAGFATRKNEAEKIS